jgi:hypothetical protein
MGWEHDDYRVACLKCGNAGSLRLSSDDWNNFESSWEGFDGIRAYQMKPAASIGRCQKCGTTEIRIGGTTNSN